MADGHTVAAAGGNGGGQERVDAALDTGEAVHVMRLLSEVDSTSTEVAQLAQRLAASVREQHTRARGTGRLMQQFPLSSEEGVALMALAEALLRVPSVATADALIHDTLSRAAWSPEGDAVGRLARFALRCSRAVASSAARAGAVGTLAQPVRPLLRAAMLAGMRRFGEHFVFASSIDEAVRQARLDGRWLHSFDMLGEAAMTADDAERYFEAYAAAARRVGLGAGGAGVHAADGISVKLSALHPRYTWMARDRVLEELVERLRALCLIAAEHGIGLNVDAEEAARLELSMAVFERVALDPRLRDWEGFGFVIQAYQTRARALTDWCVDLAQRRGGRLMVRLVKGAYWDSEIKRAQVEGLAHYPVFTRRAHTDVSFIACATRLLAHADSVYPQFATHNAHSVATVLDLARRRGTPRFEFQCLHGMGEPLYHALRRTLGEPPPVRVYAPVGDHRSLLPYLVRRLLENGANSGFVRRVVDPAVGLDELLADPVVQSRASAGATHPDIPLPCALYGAQRANAMGHDLARASVRERFAAALSASRQREWLCGCATADELAAAHAVLDPANRNQRVGHVMPCTPEAVSAALARAVLAAERWAATPVSARARQIRAFAEALEAGAFDLSALLVREAGKSWGNALSEVREAVDFCRYYAAQAEQLDQHHPAAFRRAALAVSITPWNFPLAIFTGQCVAALLSGHTVLAKPAEQTPLIAAEALRLLLRAGIPGDVVQLVPGDGETVGAVLVADTRVDSVLFTGSTAVAAEINRARAGLTGDPVLIAETGGQNAMIVDATALPEHVVADVLASAFDSAGQRCSALRVLCLQEDIAEPVLSMLRGAMDELRIGVPSDPLTDIGPVIDATAHAAIETRIEALSASGHVVYRAGRLEAEVAATGFFVRPALIELDTLAALGEECFGPVLHVVRYAEADLDAVLDAINRLGYGLTLGVHTRIESRAQRIAARARVGNVYVNRNMIGAVVGTQPFGGEGLSGTGPKAGGPLYLCRLARLDPQPVDTAGEMPSADPAFDALCAWLDGPGCAWANVNSARQRAFYQCHRLNGRRLQLPGPTGEDNTLSFVAAGTVAAVACSVEAGLHQMLAAFAAGNALRLHGPGFDALRGDLPEIVAARLVVCDEAELLDGADVLLCDATGETLRDWRLRAAARSGPLVQVWRPQPFYPVTALVRERALSINTAAAGGNVRLMALDA